MIDVAHHVDTTTYEAFRLYVLEEWKPARVAEHLGVTRNAVYLAKNRVINRMRDLQAETEEIW
ncbi:MAG: sigma-70 family RNA polymerase sigma factor [Planctomycetes bacterium]|nr:sigma-70 family RNA polymerase sigma factor [Planctomycetota bacterium]